MNSVRFRAGVGRGLLVCSLAATRLACGCIIFLMGATLVDVVGRKLFGFTVPALIEITQVVLIVAVFPALGYAQRKGQHVATSLLTSRLPETVSTILRILGLLAAALTLLYIFIKTGQRAYEATVSREYALAILQVPTWPSRIVLFAGLGLFLAEIIRTIAVRLRQRTGGTDVDSNAKNSSTLKPL